MRKLNYKFIVLACLMVGLFQINLLSQIDSLKKVAQNLPEGKEKMAIYEQLALIFEYEDIQKSLAYSDSIKWMAQELNDELGIGIALLTKASAYSTLDSHTVALNYCQQAMSYFEKEKEASRLSETYNLMGIIYQDLELLKESSDHLLQAIQYTEQTGDTLTTARAYYNLGTTFFELNNYSLAKKYFLHALDLCEQIGAYEGHVFIYDALGNVENDTSQQRLVYYKKALTYGEEEEFKLLGVNNNIGTYYNDIGQYRTALRYFLKDAAIAKKYEDPYYQAQALVNTGRMYIELNQPDSAIYYINRGLALVEPEGYDSLIEDAYEILSEAHEQGGQFQQALKYSRLAFDIRDTLYQQDINQTAQTNAARYEFEKNQRKIAEQALQIEAQQNLRRQTLLFALLVLMIVIGLYQWYLYREQRKKRAADLALLQEQAETQKLRELDQLKSDFFTNISHELRTPLTLILAPTADAIEQSKSNSLKEKLRIIQSNGQSLLNLVNEIMDLSKLEVGQLALQTQQVALRPLLRRLFYAFDSLAGLRNLNYQYQDELEQGLKVELDVEKFEKIINNLLSNAIKYTSTGGRVTLTVREVAESFIFEVSDNGQGIHPDDQAHVFRRFYQAKQSHMPLQGGTGVGLALSKELSKLMGGELTFTSEWGRGSTFILKLFLKKEALTADEVAHQPDLLVTTSTTFPVSYPPIFINDEKPRLLIVEDNPDMSRYLEQSLSVFYHCTTAADGQEGLKKLRLFDFQCIVSDVMMPNMDGFEFRAAVNQNPKWRQIPFLLLTARYLEADKLKGFQLGIDDYVTKPFNSKELQARIYNLIRNKLERDEFLKANAPEKETTPQDLSVEQQLLQQAEQTILEHLDEVDFKVKDLAQALAYSPKQLGRIIKKLTGLSSVAFILEIRLQRARALIEQRRFATVTEVMYEVGIQSTSYFTRKFTERFGKNPSEL